MLEMGLWFNSNSDGIAFCFQLIIKIILIMYAKQKQQKNNCRYTTLDLNYF